MAKSSVAFSLEQSHIQFIEQAGTGANISAKLRSILDKLEQEGAELVSFDKARIEKGDYSPLRVLMGAFMLFTKTPESREYGEEAPMAIPSRAKPEQLKRMAEEQGFRVQEVQFKEFGFYTLWAAPMHKVQHECTYRSTLEKIRKELDHVSES